MSTKDDYDKAYTKGREHAAKADQGDLGEGKVFLSFVTGGITVGLTGVTVDHPNSTSGELEKAAYERGWKEEQEK